MTAIVESHVKGRLVEDGRSVTVTVRDGRVAGVDGCADGPDIWIAPGFLDVQVNGYAGHDVNAPSPSGDEVEAMVRALWRVGVAGVCPTVCTGSKEDMLHRLGAIRAACESDPFVARSVLGIHVEGPFISPQDGPRGAHGLEHVRPPTVEEYLRWQEASDGRVAIVTLSPEYPGAVDLIRTLVNDGVVASIGHTAATPEQIRAAVDAGARFSTHLGNGAHAKIARHPNYIWEQLAEDRLMAGFIFDGHHLPPAVMKTVIRAKGVERSVLVSDAIQVANRRPGLYALSVGGQVELNADGRVTMVGSPYLAGSAATIGLCIINAMRHAGLTLSDSVRLATANPARLLRLDSSGGRGTVRLGTEADLTLFRIDGPDGEVVVEQTIVGGRVVFDAAA